MWQVVVGDDEVDAQALRGFSGGKGADAGVHADDEPNATLGGLLDDLVAHAVAFADAVRHVVVDLSAAQLQRRLEDDDGGGAVHVVVAIDEDGLAALDGGAQALHRRAKAGHQIGRVQVAERGIEELAGLLRVLNAARRQQSRHRDRQAHLQGQPLYMLRIGVAKDPAHVSVRRPGRCRR